MSITLKLELISKAVSDLNTLKQECDGMQMSVPAIVGGGKTVNKLDEIARILYTMNQNLSSLISETSSYLQVVKTNFETADKNASVEK